MDSLGRLLVVIYTRLGDVVRLISARAATSREGCNMKNAMKREYDFKNAKPGAVIAVPRGNSRIAIRLDAEILAWFRQQGEPSGGGNYQTLINEALREPVRRAQEPLEKRFVGLFAKRFVGSLEAEVRLRTQNTQRAG